jgi:hypothetical protein
MKRLIVTLAVAGLALGAGIAYASIPDSGGVIHGCYANKDGSLRVIDTGSGGACDSKKETTLSWNQKGPTGVRGPTGAAGTSHGYYSYGGLQSFSVLGGSFTTVGELTGLPAGTYIVTARGLVEDLPNDQEAACKLVAGGADVQETVVDTFTVGSPRLPFVLSAAATLGSPGSIETDCDSNDSGGFAAALDVSMTAVAVDAVN